MSKRSTAPFAPSLESNDDFGNDLTGEATYPNPELDALRVYLKQVEAERDNAIAQVAILKAPIAQSGPTLLPDGSCTIRLTLDPDKTALYTSWAADYNMTLEQIAQQQIMEALDAYAG
jgi:hypothetical protein